MRRSSDGAWLSERRRKECERCEKYGLQLGELANNPQMMVEDKPGSEHARCRVALCAVPLT